MTFANPWGLLGLLALPAIVVIHLYHRRFPVLEVAGLHLWGVETEIRAPGRTRERLPVTASLLLELLAALLLTLVLARPQFGQETSLKHLVAVLDNSASMLARPPAEATFRDAAIAELNRRMDRLGRRSAVTLLLTGPRPTLLAGPAVPVDEAREKLQRWQPELPRHDFGPTWDLAAQLAEQATEFVFLTDHLPPKDASKPGAEEPQPTDGRPPLRTAAPESMEVIALGSPLANITISSARWTFDPRTAKGNLFLRIDNHGSRDAQVAVSGKSGPRDVFRKPVSIPKNGSIPLETELPGGLGQIDVTATAPADGLELDSRVTLIEPQLRTVSVAVTLPADDPAAPFVQRVLKALPDSQPAEPEAAQLVIGPAGSLPPSRRTLWWLGLGPLDRSEAARKKAIDLADRTPYLLDKRNPLVNGMTLGGIVWGGVQPDDSDGVPIISSGSHRLLLQLAGTQTTAYRMNIDLARSNLAESPDWPILLSNLVELRRENLPGLRQWNYRLNEQIRFRLFEGTTDPGEGNPLTLRHVGESRPLARTPIVEVPPLNDTGIYEVLDGDRLFGRFAVNFFDPAESTLSTLETATRPATPRASDAGFALENPYSWVLLLGILAIIAATLANWRVLRTR